MPPPAPTLIAVDIGNSRIKLGQFHRPGPMVELPEPVTTLELPLTNQHGQFAIEPFVEWCTTSAPDGAVWRISSVHRGATVRFTAAASEAAQSHGREWKLRPVLLADVSLAVEVDAPEKVGMDRLMGAVAANHLRAPGRAAIVADPGTALKLQVVSDSGAFIGGAILPGLAMSARALDEQTDALPCVDVEHWHTPPQPLGKATVPAIESGLFWGAVGAIRELVNRFAQDLPSRPELFVTGGGSRLVAHVLAQDAGLAVRNVPYLVLSGIVLVDAGN